MERMLSTRLRQKVRLYTNKLRKKQYLGKYDDEDEEKIIIKVLKLTRQGQRNRGLTGKIKKLAKRLHYVRLLARKELRPEWMVVTLSLIHI